MQNEKIVNEQKKVKEFQQKALIEKERVYVENDDAKEELDIETVNRMGVGSAITQKALNDLHQQLQKL